MKVSILAARLTVSMALATTVGLGAPHLQAAASGPSGVGAHIAAAAGPSCAKTEQFALQGHHMDGSTDPNVTLTAWRLSCPNSPGIPSTDAGGTPASHYRATHAVGGVLPTHRGRTRLSSCKAPALRSGSTPAYYKDDAYYYPPCNSGNPAYATVNVTLSGHYFVRMSYYQAQAGAYGYVDLPDQYCNTSGGFTCYNPYQFSGVSNEQYTEVDAYFDKTYGMSIDWNHTGCGYSAP